MIWLNRQKCLRTNGGIKMDMESFLGWLKLGGILFVCMIIYAGYRWVRMKLKNSSVGKYF